MFTKVLTKVKVVFWNDILPTFCRLFRSIIPEKSRLINYAACFKQFWEKIKQSIVPYKNISAVVGSIEKELIFTSKNVSHKFIVILVANCLS